MTRNYASGRGALDLLVTFRSERFAIELKRVRPVHGEPDRVLAARIEQLTRYLGQLGLSEGGLLLFDLRPGRTWAERLWAEEVVLADGRRLHLHGG